MAEQFRSITETRKELPSLSQTVEGGGDRFVITNQGKPQAVLLGYSEYKGLLAAAELLNRPKELAHLEEGLAQTQRISFEELKENLRNRKAAQGEAKTVPRSGQQLAAAPLGAIDKKLDEIKGYLEKIIERSGEGERMVLVDKTPLSLEGSKRSVSMVLKEIRSGKPVEIALVEQARASTRKREDGRILATVSAMEAEK
jgi:PHD/YefM family antitoxin component YafN of YafNO toxin-antitoxin module